MAGFGFGITGLHGLSFATFIEVHDGMMNLLFNNLKIKQTEADYGQTQ